MTRAPAVLNKRTDHLPPDAVYVGRPTRWGNPFIIGRDGTRDQVIAKYERWLLAQPQLIREVGLELAGRDLICWCAPEPCHADILLRIANMQPDSYGHLVRGAWCDKPAGTHAKDCVIDTSPPPPPQPSGAIEQRKRGGLASGWHPQ